MDTNSGCWTFGQHGSGASVNTVLTALRQVTSEQQEIISTSMSGNTGLINQIQADLDDCMVLSQRLLPLVVVDNGGDPGAVIFEIPLRADTALR